MFVIIGWLVVLGCVFGVFIAHGGNIRNSIMVNNALSTILPIAGWSAERAR